MKVYTLHREQYLPIDIDTAWAFFSSAENLAKITPPGMNFRMLVAPGTGIYTGMRLHYRLTPLLGIPVKWETEIREVNAPHKFMDKQMKGPYALWEHTHTFTRVAGGIKMTDDVRYALPWGKLGKIAHALVVKRKLEKIFDFRKNTLRTTFGEYKI